MFDLIWLGWLRVWLSNRIQHWIGAGVPGGGIDLGNGGNDAEAQRAVSHRQGIAWAGTAGADMASRRGGDANLAVLDACRRTITSASGRRSCRSRSARRRRFRSGFPEAAARHRLAAAARAGDLRGFRLVGHAPGRQEFVIAIGPSLLLAPLGCGEVGCGGHGRRGGLDPLRAWFGAAQVCDTPRSVNPAMAIARTRMLRLP